MSCLKSVVFLAIGLLLPAAPAMAGAWPQAAGTMEVIAGATFSQSDSGFDGRVGGPDPKFRKLEVSPLISWGVDGTTTLSVQPSWQSLKADDADGGSDKAAGLADAEFALRRTVWQAGAEIVALQPLIRVPLGYDRGAQPPLGSGKVDAEMRALYGYGFDSGFFDGQLAYRTRGGPAADELRLDLTWGWRPDVDWLLLAQSFNAVSTGTPGPGYGDVRRYKVQLSAVRRLSNDVGLQVGLSKAIGGRNAGGERMALLALWWQFGR
ncbi:hypothetical protein CHU95_09455 [Niveispirillum lacus]|uniref:Transporter n=1 Tax=Niveispirillum lacus TaxID=1981099 RepID=A0A255Z028_9PROT|nr:hypothetical protein [Niveispirillum lacus]OYQ34808.1 hypothetical protein CHU95_09455 [Niveispirillum lacus]